MCFLFFIPEIICSCIMNDQGASSTAERQRGHIPKMGRRTCNKKEYDKATAMCKNSAQKAEGSDAGEK